MQHALPKPLAPGQTQTFFFPRFSHLTPPRRCEASLRDEGDGGHTSIFLMTLLIPEIQDDSSEHDATADQHCNAWPFAEKVPDEQWA